MCVHTHFQQSVDVFIVQAFYNGLKNFAMLHVKRDRLCGLVVRVLDYRSGGPGSIPCATRFSEEKKRKTSSGSGTGSTQPREYN
jgi:hypothetical protein